METFRLDSISKYDAYRLPYLSENIYFRIWGFYYSSSLQRRVVVSKLYVDDVLMDLVEHPTDLFVYRIKDYFVLKFGF